MKHQDSELSYVAGLFDALGNIKIRVPKDDIKSAFLFVWVTSSNFRMIQFLQHFGATLDRKDVNQFRAKWKDAKAYNFLRSIVSHSKLKRDQIEVGIEFFINKLKNEDPQSYVLPLKIRLRLLKKEDQNT